MCVALKRAVLWSVLLVGNCLTSESVQGSALSLQGVDDVHSCDGLPLGVLCVCNGITDYIFQEDFEYTSGLFVDESGDSLDTTSAGQTTDSWLGNTLDVVTKNFPVTLSATLTQTLSTFTTSRHSCYSESSNC